VRRDDVKKVEERTKRHVAFTDAFAWNHSRPIGRGGTRDYFRPIVHGGDVSKTRVVVWPRIAVRCVDKRVGFVADILHWLVRCQLFGVLGTCGGQVHGGGRRCHVHAALNRWRGHVFSGLRLYSGVRIHRSVLGFLSIPRALPVCPFNNAEPELLWSGSGTCYCPKCVEVCGKLR
jgi:hypothetical protein